MVVLISIPLVISDVEYFHGLIGHFILEKCPFESFAYFLFRLFFVLESGF